MSTEWIKPTDLGEFVIAVGMAAIGAVPEYERTLLVGPRYAHLAGREHTARDSRLVSWCSA
ncbi:hypothetical protein BH11MYX1_BH11MYX1_47910 [soil metagenome]